MERANKVFLGFKADELSKEIAPGKNRVIYLLGHLIAVHDAMFPILGLGERLHPELDAIFVSSPETAAQWPPGELRKYWDEVNNKLLSQFATLSADKWLQPHYAMSEEDYARDPTRNRLAVLLSRTNHMSYHLGQITLAQIAEINASNSPADPWPAVLRQHRYSFAYERRLRPLQSVPHPLALLSRGCRGRAAIRCFPAP